MRALILTALVLSLVGMYLTISEYSEPIFSMCTSFLISSFSSFSFSRLVMYVSFLRNSCNPNYFFEFHEFASVSFDNYLLRFS